jgi:GNAT superfamily N-acetyltransferase
MLELIRELAVYEKAPNEVTVDPLHFAESGFGENPVWWAFVVEVDETQVDQGYPSPNIGKRIVAFALYYIRYSTWKGQTMYLEDIIVTNSMRGKGIGGRLMDRLMEEAREKHFPRISWQVLDWNQPAINFYKKYNAVFDPEWVNVTLVL